ncbi:MAG: hypothetical protein LUG95_03410 [Clostridiales bacterium]|nr:hypothetical protein [Clostridiales bacterium]
MLILNVQGKITEKDNKKNIVHEFDVSENTSFLKINFSYSPKTLADKQKSIALVSECFYKYNEKPSAQLAEYLPIKNLITVSVDDNGEYRGAAHRQDSNQEHIISRDSASPGFLKGEIHSDKWRIVLNVHSVSCDVKYNLTVQGGRNI